jgi:hypothetical protein
MNKGLLNTNSAITRQLMRTARTLEAEWRQVLRGSVGRGTKEDESSAGRVWAAGFHDITARSRFARSETYEPFISLIFLFWGAAVNRGYCISGYGGTPVYVCVCVWEEGPNKHTHTTN